VNVLPNLTDEDLPLTQPSHSDAVDPLKPMMPSSEKQHAQIKTEEAGRGEVRSQASIAKPSELTNISESVFKITGGSPEDYELGLDRKTLFDGKPTVYFGARTSSPKGFGAIIHSVEARPYVGRMVELSGFLKTEGAEGSASLWMRIDGPSGMLKIDSMSDRKILGQTDWTEYRISMPVPIEAEKIAVGIINGWNGQVWGTRFRIQAIPSYAGESPLKIELEKNE
jgi:hypothetical protein